MLAAGYTDFESVWIKILTEKQKQTSPNSITFWSVTFTADLVCVWSPHPLPPPHSPPSYKHTHIRQDAYQFAFKISFQLKSVACCRLSKSIYALENFRALMRWWKDHATIWTPESSLKCNIFLIHSSPSNLSICIVGQLFWGRAMMFEQGCVVFFLHDDVDHQFPLCLTVEEIFISTLRVHLPVESTSSSWLYLLFLVFCLFFCCLFLIQNMTMII